MRLSTILIFSFIFVGIVGSSFGTYSYYDQSNQLLKESIKINEEEVLENIRTQLIQSFIISTIIMIIFVSLLGSIVSSFVSKPLQELTQTVDEITKGKLDIQLPKSRIEEIKRLTDSLNRILASLKLAIMKTGAKGSELGLGEVIRAKEAAKEELEHSKKTLDEIQKISKIGSWEYRPLTKYAKWSNGLLYLLGYNPGEFKESADAYTKNIVKEDRNRVWKEYNDAVRKKKDFHSVYKMMKKDKSIIIVDAQGKNTYDKNGKIVSTIGFIRDITEGGSTTIKKVGSTRKKVKSSVDEKKIKRGLKK